MASERLSWYKLAELTLLLLAVIITGFGVAASVKSDIASLQTEMRTVKESYQELRHDINACKSELDKLSGMHAKEIAASSNYKSKEDR